MRLTFYISCACAWTSTPTQKNNNLQATHVSTFQNLVSNDFSVLLGPLILFINKKYSSSYFIVWNLSVCLFHCRSLIKYKNRILRPISKRRKNKKKKPDVVKSYLISRPLTWKNCMIGIELCCYFNM